MERYEHSVQQSRGLDAVLRTKSALSITHQSQQAAGIALQVSRNMLQYFNIDCRVIKRTSDLKRPEGAGNAISVHVGSSVPRSWLPTYPIWVSQKRLTVRDPNGALRSYTSEDHSGLGAIFLHPLSSERLELTIWGADDRGLAGAARLVPLFTGTGQPDFIIVTSQCRSEGLHGAVGVGYFDNNWNVSTTSFLS